MWTPVRILTRWFRRRQRQMDREVLFPAIRALQKTQAQGDETIAAHIAVDPAWRFGEEYAQELLESSHS